MDDEKAPRRAEDAGTAADPPRRKKRTTRSTPRSVIVGPADEPGPVHGVARALADAASGVAGPIASVARPVVQGVTRPVESVESVARPAVQGAVRRWRESGQQRSELRARARVPLPSLWEVHPEARRARPRELGLQTVPLDRIRGTAVEGPVQRGGDFLPLQHLRGSNWLSRWQRIRRAVDRLEILPPIDLVRYSDDYWVVDGHNRVGAALYAGQQAIDASVVDLWPLGGRASSTDRTVPALAQIAEEGREVRALGEGRFSRTASTGSHFVDLRSGLERRSGEERRKAETVPPGEERRSGHDRRSGEERRGQP